MKTTTSTFGQSRSRPVALTLLIAAAIALALSALALTATSAQSAERRASTTPVTGGKTLLFFDRGTAAALSGAGVSVKATGAAVGPAGSRVFAFPIVGGKVDKKQLSGRVVHSGGLSFTAGGERVVVKRFVIDLGEGLLSAKVAGGGRVPLLSLSVPKGGVATAPRLLVIKGAKAKLTPEAARALNQAFATDLFKAGLPIGKANIIARTGV